MVIDEELLSGEITPAQLSKLIHMHESLKERYRELYNYYIGRHTAIENRERSAAGAANNKIIVNHAKYITDMIQGYLTGNPVMYSASETYDIETIKDAYLEQDIASVDSELVKDMSIYGRAYELIFANEKSKPRSVRLSPNDTFVCYSQTADKKPLFGVYYYRKYDLDGYCTGTVCRVYNEYEILTYESAGESFDGLVLNDGREAHYFGGVPVIEYRNNAEKQGDFEQVISLIDAYNALQSDRVNDKEQFVDSFLFLINCEIDSEDAKRLIKERILMGNTDARAQYLSKTLSEADVKLLRDDIKNDIHRMSNVPDLSDESFGNNLSGVAIKYKLLGFEQHIKNKEKNVAKALRRRLELYNNFLVSEGKMGKVPTHRVDITFSYNLPANNPEIAQMISTLNGMVTQETLVGQLDFVNDPKEEAALAKKEKADEYDERIRRVEGIARGGGYDGGSFGVY